MSRDRDAALSGQRSSNKPDVVWLGWAVVLPYEPWLYVEYCPDEATAWRHALGWPDADEIAHAKASGARAFPVQITERQA